MRKLNPFMAMTVLLFAFASRAEQPIPPAATELAKQYLTDIDKSASFPPIGKHDRDFIFIGTARAPSSGWRIVVIADYPKQRIVWDSAGLRDRYLSVTGLSFVNAEADGGNGYTITMRGCVPHQCSDGRIGFAIYASRTRKTYMAHVTTKDDGSYRVSYYPRSGMPRVYHDELHRMMCSDGGISRPLTLPMNCPH